MSQYRIEVRYSDEDLLLALVAMYQLSRYDAIAKLASMSAKEREDLMEKFHFGHPDDEPED